MLQRASTRCANTLRICAGSGSGSPATSETPGARFEVAECSPPCESTRRCVATMNLSWRAGRLDADELLDDPITMQCPSRHDPRIARAERDSLALALELCAALDHVSHGFVVASSLGRVRSRLFLPESHRERRARRQIDLPGIAVRREPRIDLDDAGITCSAHGGLHHSNEFPQSDFADDEHPVCHDEWTARFAGKALRAVRKRAAEGLTGSGEIYPPGRSNA